jgi:hypothetical protein
VLIDMLTGAEGSTFKLPMSKLLDTRHLSRVSCRRVLHLCYRSASRGLRKKSVASAERCGASFVGVKGLSAVTICYKRNDINT